MKAEYVNSASRRNVNNNLIQTIIITPSLGDGVIFLENIAMYSIKNHTECIVLDSIIGAGEGNRTPVLSLEGYSNNHYTTPARWKDFI